MSSITATNIVNSSTINKVGEMSVTNAHRVLRTPNTVVVLYV